MPQASLRAHVRNKNFLTYAILLVKLKKHVLSLSDTQGGRYVLH